MNGERYSYYRYFFNRLSDGQNVHRTKIHVTPNMAPDSHIMVVFVSSKGELLAAEKEVRVDNVLANFVCTDSYSRDYQFDCTVEFKIFFLDIFSVICR